MYVNDTLMQVDFYSMAQVNHNLYTQHIQENTSQDYHRHKFRNSARVRIEVSVCEPILLCFNWTRATKAKQWIRDKQNTQYVKMKPHIINIMHAKD